MATEAACLIGSVAVKLGETVIGALLASHGSLPMSDIKGAFKDNELSDELVHLVMRSLEHRKLAYEKDGQAFLFIPCQGEDCSKPVDLTLEDHCWDCTPDGIH